MLFFYKLSTKVVQGIYFTWFLYFLGLGLGLVDCESGHL